MTVADEPMIETRIRSAADWLASLGDVPLARIVFDPLPGTATETDVVRLDARHDILCELVDGTLVEKAVGFNESLIAGRILVLLSLFIHPRKLGKVAGEAGMVKLFPQRIRIPDVCFVANDRLPAGDMPAIPKLAPNLVVEVFSKTNTPREMEIKLEEYFRAGVQVVWIVYPESRSVYVYRGPDRPVELAETDTLTAEPALEGFSAKVRELFED